MIRLNDKLTSRNISQGENLHLINLLCMALQGIELNDKLTSRNTSQGGNLYLINLLCMAYTKAYQGIKTRLG